MLIVLLPSIIVCKFKTKFSDKRTFVIRVERSTKCYYCCLRLYRNELLSLSLPSVAYSTEKPQQFLKTPAPKKNRGLPNMFSKSIAKKGPPFALKSEEYKLLNKITFFAKAKFTLFRSVFSDIHQIDI